MRAHGSRAWLTAALVAAAAIRPAGAAEGPRHTEDRDSDGDGKPDLWITREGERVVLIQRDRNQDGVPDLRARYLYENGQKEGRVIGDRDFNRQPDYWRLDLQNRPVREWGDQNGDGEPDLWSFYGAEGRKVWMVLDKNGDGRPDAWLYYGPSGQGAPSAAGAAGPPRAVAGEVDEDCDGTPEKSFGALPAERPALTPPPSVS